jgi:hypothetical protein
VARVPIVVAVLGLAVSAVPASAAVTATPTRSGVDLDGYAAGAPLSVEIVRNGVSVGRASGAADATGVLAVNGGGTCWTSVTPELRPGDHVTVNGAEAMVVQALGVAAPAAAPGGGVLVTGTATDPGGAALPADALAVRVTAGPASVAAPGDGAVTADGGGAFSAAFPLADPAALLGGVAQARAATRRWPTTP